VNSKVLPLSCALAGLTLCGCHTDMWRQPKTEPLDASTYFTSGAASQPLVPGTIPRGYLRVDDEYYTGQIDGKWIDGLPSNMHLSTRQLRDLLQRGQERFNIYCSPCHSRIGDGQGMIAQRGFTLRRPVGNYHTDRLRKMPMGHFYDVITNGYGAMYSYASRIEPQDRWAIAAYIRALQLSQHATDADVQQANNMKASTENSPLSEKSSPARVATR
jgi:mono/diheme cytochrome c family protein